MKESTKKILIIVMCAVCMIAIIGVSVWVNIDRELIPDNQDQTNTQPDGPVVNQPNEPGREENEDTQNPGGNDTPEKDENKPLSRDEVLSQYFRKNLEIPTERIITMESRQAYVDSIALKVNVVEEIHEFNKGEPGGGFHLKFDGKMMYGIRKLRYYLEDGTEIVLKDVTEELNLTDRNSWPGVIFTDYHNEYRLVNMSTSVFFPKEGIPPTMSVCTDEEYQAYMNMFGDFVEDTWNEKWNDAERSCLCSVTSFDYDKENKVVLVSLSTTIEGLQADGVEIQIFHADGTLIEEYDMDEIKSKYSFNLEGDYSEYLFVRARLYADTDAGRIYNYYCKAARIDGIVTNENLFQ